MLNLAPKKDKEDQSKSPKLYRRELMNFGFAGVIGAAVPLIGAREAAAGFDVGSWEIKFRHGHTGESFNGIYRIGDRYLPEAFENLNYVMRDFRTGEVFPMDPHVLDVMTLVRKKTGQSGPVEVLSGYRSPKTNAMLRSRSGGVAKNSFHMYGQAIDFRLPGYNTKELRNIARGLKVGGVGYYPGSDFVHIDTGSVRSW